MTAVIILLIFQPENEEKSLGNDTDFCLNGA